MAEDEVGFVTMGSAQAAAQPAPEIGVGMLGYGFMGKAHSNALKTLPYMVYPPPAVPKLVGIAGRNAEAVQTAAQRYGWQQAYTDWRALLDNPEVQLFDNCGPNNAHAEACITAAQTGRHILCEKPLGRTAAEAATMLEAVTRAGVKHLCAFNYRFVPAVRLARHLIETGQLGEIYHFRAVYLQEWIVDPAFGMVWRLNKAEAGSGALGDLGSHILDLARFLVGEPRQVSAMAKTFIKERPTREAGGGTGEVTVDDAFAAVLDFENGALGTVEASRFCPGRKNGQVFEINGSLGSLRFSLERLNELEVYWQNEAVRDTHGFHTVLVSEAYHPFWKYWWPQGHIIGWEHTFIHQFAHLFESIVNDTPVAPYAATFDDGYKNAVICDAILRSAETGRQQAISY
ncbi:MAG: Gfo/Idh/MocA family oxidoreductase [Anaerolineales bacterium]|nr:Gfo/Idh/MocA family oxidoreductase [Anaerolineales bacterium]